jgi:hypothetical protein
MKLLQALTTFFALIDSSKAFVAVPSSTSSSLQKFNQFSLKQSLSDNNSNDNDNSSPLLTRRQWFTVAGVTALITSGILSPIQSSFADVSDGTSLPQGAQQFARVARLKNNIAVSFLTMV